MTSQRPPRLVVVSNRGPYRIIATKRGLKRERTVGGLVTSVLPMLEQLGGTWLAWGDPDGTFPIPPRRPRFELRHIHLEPDDVQGYYHGLSNSGLWPLCHFFLGRARFERADWEAYERVNCRFAEAALEAAGPDDIIWVHDYQLGRVPAAIRRSRPKARLLYFWHIPFPPVEVFRTFPWRRPLLESLLACNLVGFHIPEYAKNFQESVAELLGAELDGELVRLDGVETRVMARPIGIDFGAVERAARRQKAGHRLQQLTEGLRQQPLILGVERMDYTKGILERLRGVEYLLEHKPQWRGKFSLIQIVTPSRTAVESYAQKKREVDEAVGRINGRFSEGMWLPVRYLYRSFSINELIMFYRTAQVALVTPLRDGLNLVAKEYVATRVDGDGVLVLSEFAGVAQQLPEALLVNPYSVEEMAATIERALQMPVEEQRQRMSAMRDRLRAQDIRWWAREFLQHAA